MEVISTICVVLIFLAIILAFFALLLIPISFLIYLILLCRKAKTKKLFGLITLGLVCTVLVFTISIFPLAVIGAMTDPSTWCEHKYQIVNQINATCNTEGSISKKCSECGSEISEKIDKLEHIWVETITEATCTDQGERTKKCSICGETIIETIEAHHSYTETIVSEPKCESDGRVQRICSVCGDTQDKPIPATGHAWADEKIITKPECEKEGNAQLNCKECGSKKDKAISATGHSWNQATCTEAKTCSVCNAEDGNPIGHTTDAGVCSRCNETVKKQSPVTIVGMRYTTNYVGGVEWTFRIRNNTDKEIKYITFQWTCYNAVDDPIRDEISGKTYVRIKFTGPLGPGETTGKQRNTTLFYNHSYAKMKWNEITVEYMDGTTETITEYYEGYYQQ